MSLELTLKMEIRNLVLVNRFFLKTTRILSAPISPLEYNFPASYFFPARLPLPQSPSSDGIIKFCLLALDANRVLGTRVSSENSLLLVERKWKSFKCFEESW